METVLLKRHFCCLFVAVVGLLGQYAIVTSASATKTVPSSGSTSSIANSSLLQTSSQSTVTTGHSNSTQNISTASLTTTKNITVTTTSARPTQTTTPKRMFQCHEYACTKETGIYNCTSSGGTTITKDDEAVNCTSQYGCYTNATADHVYDVGCLMSSSPCPKKLKCCKTNFCNKILDESGAHMHGLNQSLIVFLCFFVFWYSK